MKVMQQELTLEQEEEIFLMYENETEDLFRTILVYFNTHQRLAKVFRVPISTPRFYKEFVTLVANKQCGWKVEKVRWNSDKVRIIISDPFEFDEYCKKYIK